MNPRILLLALLCFAWLMQSAQDTEYTLSDDSLVNKFASQMRVYYATRTNLVPKIDGILNDSCWKNSGTWAGGFIQQQPHQARPPSQETEVKILYDDKYLYFAIICHDKEPEKMSPILGRRDDFTSGDIAGIALDSYNDKQTAFEFNLTAAGQKVDLMHMGEYGWDFNWDAVWDGKTSTGDSAWYAEMRIPFTQLRFSNEKEHVWGMHIWRYLYRLKEESQWKLIPIDAPAMVYIFGELRGIRDIPYKRNFEIMPYAKAKYISDLAEKNKYGFGLDGKIGVSSNFTLDYTFNPDFGQVEADPSELNLTSFETFYEEKRPFFLEGNSIIEYNASHDMLFYSRRIGHAPGGLPEIEEGEDLIMPENASIINALKLTGKNKSGFSMGIINSMTAREEARIKTDYSSRKEAVEPFTNYFIGRAKQDFNDGSTVLGGIVTSTLRDINDPQLDFLSEKAFVGGVDFEHNWLNRKYFINAKSFFSKIAGSERAIANLQLSSRHLYQREDADHLDFDETLSSLKGWGGEFSTGKRSGKFRLVGTIDWRSPGVDLNDVGYMRQADYIKQDVRFNYNVHKPNKWLLSYLIMIDQRHHWSYGKENLKDELDAHLRLRFKNYWTLDADIDRTYNELDTRQLRGGPALRIDGSTSSEIFIQTNSSKNLFLGGGLDITRFDDQISSIKEYSFFFQWMVSNRFSISSHTCFSGELNNNQYVLKKKINDKMIYLVGLIDRNTLYTTIRAEYFVTPELSLQYYGSPYASTGKFLDYRKVTDSKSRNIAHRYTKIDIVHDLRGKYLFDGDEMILDFRHQNPDFNFQEFRSNFVARWEYKTGSTLYFVWTNYKSNYESQYNPSITDSFKSIARMKSQNAFMVKLSYWFSL